MKNLIKISLIAVTFLAFSCNKEVIRPNTSPSDETIVTKSSSNNNPNTGVVSDGGTGITDPNNDPDINIKKVTVIIKPN